MTGALAGVFADLPFTAFNLPSGECLPLIRSEHTSTSPPPIWILFPVSVERWFMSPAQHQLHHSIDPSHWEFLAHGWRFGTNGCLSSTDERLSMVSPWLSAIIVSILVRLVWTVGTLGSINMILCFHSQLPMPMTMMVVLSRTASTSPVKMVLLLSIQVKRWFGGWCKTSPR